MADARDLLFLTMVQDAIDKPVHDVKTTDKCTECDQAIGDQYFQTADHWYLYDRQRGEHVIVIGCQGYYVINPNAVGINDPKWCGIEGVNI